MQVNFSKINLIMAAAVGCAAAALTMGIGRISELSSSSAVSALQNAISDFLAPGIFVAIVLGGNAHAFYLWSAASANFVRYFLLVWVFGLVVRKAMASANAPGSK